MRSKKKFREEAALHYAQQHNIAIKEDSEDGIVAAIKDFVGIQQFKCNECEAYIRNEDTYCWRCGEDVSEDGSGGFDRIASAKATLVPVEEENIEEQEAPALDPEPAVAEEPELTGTGEMREEQEPVEEQQPKETKMAQKTAKKTKLEVLEGGDLPTVAEKKTKSLDGMSLDKRVQEIRQLDGSTGFAAWQIGKHLFEIKEGELYKEKGIKSFADFCVKELAYTRRTAYNYIDIAQKFDPDQAKRLGLFQLMILNNDDLTEKDLSKLVEKAPEMTTKDLKAKVNELQEKAREKRGEEPKKPSAKKASNPLKSFLGVTAKGKYLKDDHESAIIQLDDGNIGIQVTILKTGVKIEFVELAEEE